MALTDRLDEIDARLARIADRYESTIERRMAQVRLQVEDVPALVAALRAVLDLHQFPTYDTPGDEMYRQNPRCSCGMHECPERDVIESALGGAL